MKKVLVLIAVFAIGVIVGTMAIDVINTKVDETRIVKKVDGMPTGYAEITYKVVGLNSVERSVKVKDLANGYEPNKTETIDYFKYFVEVGTFNSMETL